MGQCRSMKVLLNLMHDCVFNNHSSPILCCDIFLVGVKSPGCTFNNNYSTVLFYFVRAVLELGCAWKKGGKMVISWLQNIKWQFFSFVELDLCVSFSLYSLSFQYLLSNSIRVCVKMRKFQVSRCCTYLLFFISFTGI